MSDDLVMRLRDNASNLQCAGFVEAPEVLRQAADFIASAQSREAGLLKIKEAAKTFVADQNGLGSFYYEIAVNSFCALEEALAALTRAER